MNRGIMIGHRMDIINRYDIYLMLNNITIPGKRKAIDDLVVIGFFTYNKLN